jgi:dephospho-CoA kinase
MKMVVCFSGGIASGKTSLAGAVAERLEVPCASFGRFVRSTAKTRGLGEERGALQALGESLINELGWDAFCRAVLEDASWKPDSSIVVDGIRHEVALKTVRSLAAPVVTKLVYVDVPVEVREARASGRSDEKIDLTTAEKHATEKDVQHVLRGMADLIVDGRRDVPSLVDDVKRVLGL